jgi:hypothetical protein
MGLLEKRNPQATRRTVFRSAILGAVGFFIFALIMLIRSTIIRPDDFPPWAWVLMLVFMTVGGSVTGAAIEWQLPPIDYADEEAGEDALSDRRDK